MVATNAWNRLHNLSAPPPARQDRLLPNAGCQPCLASRVCPYRGVWKCQDHEMAKGVAQGFCELERGYRAQEAADARGRWRWRAECGRAEAERLLELLLDSLVYVARATAWLDVLRSARTDEAGFLDDPEERRALIRYRLDGGRRLLRRLRDVREHGQRWRLMLDPKPAAAAGAGPHGGRTQPPGPAEDEEELPNPAAPGWVDQAPTELQGGPAAP